MQSSAAEKARWWLWPTILSWDAPIVVLLWQGLLARCAAVRLGPAEMVVLGFSVWLAYAADRWIEGWRLQPEAIQTHRHKFYQRWRWPIAFVWVAVLALDGAVAVGGLSSREFLAGALLLVPVSAYLLSHQLVHRGSPWRAPKEICIAALLGAGAGIFPASRQEGSLQVIALPIALFMLLCFSNCTLISLWEHEVDRLHGQTSLALQFGGTGALGRILPWGIAVLCGALFFAHKAPETAGCAGVSAVLLGLVDRAETRIGRMPARVLADVALLTPLAVLLFERHP